jgi:hypothetical protein
VGIGEEWCFGARRLERGGLAEEGRGTEGHREDRLRTGLHHVLGQAGEDLLMGIKQIRVVRHHWD